MKKVVVGSENPVKIEAVRQAFVCMWPNETWEIVGIKTDSGVSNQPMSDVESIQGATNRAQAAIAVTGADFGVGLEGGLQQIGDSWYDSGWIVVIDRTGRMGIGSTIKIIVPKEMMDLIMAGEELGIVCDKVFGTHNSKQGQGHFGLMTNNTISRTSGYRDGVLSAFALLIHSELHR